MPTSSPGSRCRSPAGSWERSCDTTEEDIIALNKERIGHRYSPYRYEVSREKIREYAFATGVHDPKCTAESGEIEAPPGFAACFTVIRGGTAMFSDGELGVHPALVHGAQEFTYHRPIKSGDVFECTPWVADIRERGRNEFLTLQIDCVDASTGEPVVTSRGTIVFLGSAANQEG